MKNENSENATTPMEFVINGATVTVDHIGPEYSPEDRAERQRYSYVIRTVDFEYVGNDISSGCGAPGDVAHAARVLFTLLDACAEAREYTARRGLAPAENDDLFPEHVGIWAQENCDEILILSMDPRDHG